MSDPAFVDLNPVPADPREPADLLDERYHSSGAWTCNGYGPGGRFQHYRLRRLVGVIDELVPLGDVRALVLFGSAARGYGIAEHRFWRWRWTTRHAIIPNDIDIAVVVHAMPERLGDSPAHADVPIVRRACGYVGDSYGGYGWEEWRVRKDGLHVFIMTAAMLQESASSGHDAAQAILGEGVVLIGDPGFAVGGKRVVRWHTWSERTDLVVE